MSAVRRRGFTTVELLVAIAIAAILAAAAVPSFRTYAANQRLRSASFDLVSDLVVARSEALKRNTPVRLAPVGGGWRDGWVVRVEASGERLRERGAIGTGLEIDATRDAIVFDRSGRVADVAGVVRFGLAAESERLGATPRCVTLDPTGRARSERRSCT